MVALLGAGEAGDRWTTALMALWSKCLACAGVAAEASESLLGADASLIRSAEKDE